MQGIYKITYIKNKKCYVGSSTNIENRWKNHINNLKKGNHPSKGLQNVYNKHGLNSLKFEVIEEVQCKDNLIEREQYWINTLNSYYKGFNGVRLVDGRAQLNEKQRQNISIKTKLGMNKSEIKDRMRKAKLGSKCPIAKLNEQQVEKIKLLLSKELVNRRALAKEYNVSIDTIDDIISEKTWSHIRPDLKCLTNKIYKLNESQVKEIKVLLNENKLTQLEIAKRFGIAQQTISNIKVEKIWKSVT